MDLSSISWHHTGKKIPFTKMVLTDKHMTHFQEREVEWEGSVEEY